MSDVEERLRRDLEALAAATSTSPDAWERTVARAARRGPRAKGARALSVACAVVLVVAGAVAAIRDRSSETPLARAVAATADQRRFGFSYVEEVTSPGQPPDVTAIDGQYDEDRHVAWASRSSGGPVVGPELVTDSKRVFLSTALLPPQLIGSANPPTTPWVVFDTAVDASQLGEAVGLAGLTNLRAALQRVTSDPLADLSGGGVRITPQGSEVVRGVETTRSTVRFDTRELAAAQRTQIERRLAAEGDPRRAANQLLLQQLAAHPESVLPAEATVWIGSNSLIRRYQVVHEGPPVTDPSGPPIRSVATTEFFDFGAALAHDVPPAAEATPVTAHGLPPATAATIPAPAAATTRPVDPTSFFAIRPVLAQLPPPCPSNGPTPGLAVLAQLTGGAAVACYEVGPVAVDAHDVASATARTDPTNGGWFVQFTLTREGTARFNAAAAALGVGHQLAVVVDGAVVNAPQLDTVNFPGAGRITGFDASGAQALADRLQHQ